MVIRCGGGRSSRSDLNLQFRDLGVPGYGQVVALGERPGSGPRPEPELFGEPHQLVSGQRRQRRREGGVELSPVGTA